MIFDTSMALLTRYLHLTNPDETHVFNFVVTKSVTRDLSRDVVSKDFIFASHKWALSVNRQEKVSTKVFRFAGALISRSVGSVKMREREEARHGKKQRSRVRGAGSSAQLKQAICVSAEPNRNRQKPNRTCVGAQRHGSSKKLERKEARIAKK